MKMRNEYKDLNFEARAALDKTIQHNLPVTQTLSNLQMIVRDSRTHKKISLLLFNIDIYIQLLLLLYGVLSSSMLSSLPLQVNERIKILGLGTGK
jgi:hypothetical protein